MKHIKLFEELKDKESIERDIRGILIDLKDKLMDISIVILNKSLVISITNSYPFESDVIKEYLLTVEDYLKYIWLSQINTKYEIFIRTNNWYYDWYCDSSNLNNNMDVTKVVLNISKSKSIH